MANNKDLCDNLSVRFWDSEIQGWITKPNNDYNIKNGVIQIYCNNRITEYNIKDGICNGLIIYMLKDEISSIIDMIEHLGFWKVSQGEYFNNEFIFKITKSTEYEGAYEILIILKI